MQILETQGSYQFLDTNEELLSQLRKIEKAGRNCYWSETGPITDETAKKFCLMLLNRGHYAMLEHGNMSVQFEGISIGETREQNRHRVGALAERSTRYVDYARGREDLDRFQLRFVLPPDMSVDEMIDIGGGEQLTVKQYLELGERFYRGVRQAGHKPDSARQFLWIGTETAEVVTTNMRQWRHIFRLRTERVAHWEIRRTMTTLLEDVKSKVPVLFDDFEKVDEDKMGIPVYRCKFVED